MGITVGDTGASSKGSVKYRLLPFGFGGSGALINCGTSFTCEPMLLLDKRLSLPSLSSDDVRCEPPSAPDIGEKSAFPLLTEDDMPPGFRKGSGGISLLVTEIEIGLDLDETELLASRFLSIGFRRRTFSICSMLVIEFIE